MIFLCLIFLPFVLSTFKITSFSPLKFLEPFLALPKLKQQYTLALRDPLNAQSESIAHDYIKVLKKRFPKKKDLWTEEENKFVLAKSHSQKLSNILDDQFPELVEQWTQDQKTTYLPVETWFRSVFGWADDSRYIQLKLERLSQAAAILIASRSSLNQLQQLDEPLYQFMKAKFKTVKPYKVDDLNEIEMALQKALLYKKLASLGPQLIDDNIKMKVAGYLDYLKSIHAMELATERELEIQRLVFPHLLKHLETIDPTLYKIAHQVEHLSDTELHRVEELLKLAYAKNAAMSDPHGPQTDQTMDLYSQLLKNSGFEKKAIAIVQKFIKKKARPECAVCLETIYHGKKNFIKLERCKHEFHIDCIGGWMKRFEGTENEPSCPMCRSDLS